MISRQLQIEIERALQRQAAVAILGPRQVGKTTLAKTIGRSRPSLYLDLEDSLDRARLSDARMFFDLTKDKLVILDEVHRLPSLFETLRGVIDRGRESGYATARFLILGSASADLLQQSGESLAGRIAYFELPPIQLAECGENPSLAQSLWIRGGFPGSLLAASEEDSYEWRKDFVETYLGREVSSFIGRVPVESLRRLWFMLANCHGKPFNASDLSRSIQISPQSVTRYVDLLCDLLLVRRLRPYHPNTNKRLVKAPRIYLRDSGILHAILGIRSAIGLTAHPQIGFSWEGFAVEQIVQALPKGATPYFYRTAAGAEIDLILEFSPNERWAIEIKRHSNKLERGFHEACGDVKPTRCYLVHGSDDCYPISPDIQAISLEAMVSTLKLL